MSASIKQAAKPKNVSNFYLFKLHFYLLLIVIYVFLLSFDYKRFQFNHSLGLPNVVDINEMRFI